MGKESPSCSEGETNLKEQETIVLKMDDDAYWDDLAPILEVPPVSGSSSEGSGDAHNNNPVPAAPPAAPAAPAGPDAPSISFLRELIKNVLHSCRKITPKRSLLEHQELNLENANEEKRLKIALILEDISRRSGYFREHKREKPHIDLIVQLHDWERSRNEKIFSGVGIYLCK